MGSSSTVGTSPTFLSNMRERASNFGTCRLLVSSAPAINTGYSWHTGSHNRKKLWSPLGTTHHAGVQHCTDPVLQALPLGELRDPLTSRAFNRGSLNETEVTALHSKWMADGSRGLRGVSVDVTSTAHAPYCAKYFLTQHLKFLHLQLSNA